MADIQRLIRALVALAFGLLIGGFSVAAFAVDNIIVAVTDYSFCGGSAQGLVGTGWPPTPQTSDFLAKGPGNSGTPNGAPVLAREGSGTYSGDWTIYQDWTQNYSSPTGQRVCRIWRGAAPTCPDGETWVPASGQCESICEPGYTWNGTTCQNPCQAKAGNSAGTASEWVTLDIDSVPSGNPSFCTNGCVATGQKIECVRASSTSGGDYVQVGQLCSVQGPFTYTGVSCAGNIPTMIGAETEEQRWWDTGKDEKDCAASGGMPGQVNGVQVCVRPQDGETWDTSTETTTEPTKETTTNPDGTTTEKTTTTTTSTDGGKTTTTTTTTTTTKDAAGNTLDTSTETKVEEKPLNDFCKDNPTDAACVNASTGGAFGGGCASGFTCTGDAVQCAIARAQHEENCQQLAAREEGQGFMESLGATEPTQASVTEALNREGEFDFDIAEAFQDAQQNYVSFTASCLPAMGFTLMGQSYEFNTAFICEIGDFVRLMLHLVAYMSVLRVISRAFG